MNITFKKYMPKHLANLFEYNPLPVFQTFEHNLLKLNCCIDCILCIGFSSCYQFRVKFISTANQIIFVADAGMNDLID